MLFCCIASSALAGVVVLRLHGASRSVRGCVARMVPMASVCCRDVWSRSPCDRIVFVFDRCTTLVSASVDRAVVAPVPLAGSGCQQLCGVQLTARRTVSLRVPVPPTTYRGDVGRCIAMAVYATAAVGVSAARTRGLPCRACWQPCLLLIHASASLPLLLVHVDHSLLVCLHCCCCGCRRWRRCGRGGCGGCCVGRDQGKPQRSRALPRAQPAGHWPVWLRLQGLRKRKQVPQHVCALLLDLCVGVIVIRCAVRTRDTRTRASGTR